MQQHPNPRRREHLDDLLECSADARIVSELLLTPLVR
jgi:hypothetical protein